MEEKVKKKRNHYSYEEKNEIVDKILEIWADNPGLTLLRLFEQFDVGVARRQFYEWRSKYPDINDKVVMAQEMVAETYIDLGQKILDETVDPRFAILAKIKADYYKWRAAKLCARLYGEKFVNTDNGPVKVSWVDDDVTKLRKMDS